MSAPAVLRAAVLARLRDDPAIAVQRVIEGQIPREAAVPRVRANALAGTIDDYRLTFEGGETLTARFLVTRLDYAGDYNGERSYTIALESSGPAVAA